MNHLKYWIVILGLLITLAGCSIMSPPVASPAPAPAPVRDRGNIVEVFYGTDRNLISTSDSSIEFGKDRSTNLHYGSCYISVPPNHTIGVIERPWLSGFFEDPEDHMILVNQKNYSSFAEFIGEIRSQPNEKMFVFIHGYNVSFEDAAYRTAQMAYDLQFDGTPIFFSWPSAGDVISYTRDENSIEWAASHIEEFIEGLIKDAPKKDIYIIAHSMGSRGASRAIASVLRENPQATSRIKEIVLAAPDIDADIFKTQIMPAFSKAEVPVTMYTSDQDRALKLSSLLHGYVRVGSSTLGAKNLEVIDASDGEVDFLGHSYFAQNVPILNDLHYLVEKGMRADSRFMLNRVDTADGPYWKLKK